MKRVLLLLQLLMLSVAAFAQKPIYVYFNDGTFKAFLSSQVDRIAVAHADDVPDSDLRSRGVDSRLSVPLSSSLHR